MDEKTTMKIFALLNYAYNLLECDKDSLNYQELKESIEKARAQSTWMYDYSKKRCLNIVEYKEKLEAYNLK